MGSSIDKYERLEEQRKEFLLSLKSRVYVDTSNSCHIIKFNSRISSSDCSLEDFVNVIVKQLQRKVDIHKQIYEIRKKQLQFDFESLKALEKELKQ